MRLLPFFLLAAFLCLAVASKTCVKCMKDASKVANTMTNSTVQMEIVAYVNKTVCQHIPNTEEKQACADLVETFYPELIDEIFQRYTPKEICRRIGFC